MQNIMNLQRRGHLTEQQVLHAYKFSKNPNAYTLAPTFYRVLHDAIINDEPLEKMEKRRGWPARSAKALISLVLHALQEVGGSHSEPAEDEDEDEDSGTAEERLAYLKADAAQDIMPLVMEYGFSPREARLFLVLARSPGRMCGKEALFTRMYADRIDDPPDVKIVDVFICKMRKKLELTRWRIDTVWGEGYMLCAADAPLPSGAKAPTSHMHDRDVFWYKLHVYDDAAYQQIARDNEVQPSTVHRAVTRLIEKYSDEQIDEAVKNLQRRA